MLGGKETKPAFLVLFLESGLLFFLLNQFNEGLFGPLYEQFFVNAIEDGSDLVELFGGFGIFSSGLDDKVFGVEVGFEELLEFGFDEELLLFVKFFQFQNANFLALGLYSLDNQKHLLNLLIISFY